MSSAVDDDVARTVAQGRASLGVLLRNAQKHLQKVFIVFLLGFLGTFMALRLYIWDILKRDLNAHPDIVVVAITPFEVILLQAKIGLAAGVIIMLPALAYFSRNSLKARGYWPQNIPRWKAVSFVIASATLFVGGIAYAYYLFFPIMFSFLAGNAVNAGFQPTYSISMWAQFIFLLAFSFGLAAQLPLFMGTLSYSEIVRYETFRDKWKYAVIGIFAFGALFSPPDPFTQIMWGVPLVTLYGVSLYISKIVVTAKRSSDAIDLKGTARARWNILAGLFVVGAAAVYAFYTYGGYLAVNDALAAVDSSYRFLPPGEGYGIAETIYLGIAGAIYGAVFAAAGFGYLVYSGLQSTDDGYALIADDPEDIDLQELDAASIRAAPDAVFEDLDEDRAVALAGQAMEADEHGRAQAILDRFDQAQEAAEASDADADRDVDDDAADDAAGDGAATAAAAGDEAESSFLASRGAGVLDAFSEDDIDEDDVGGYAYDIAFVVDSITSKSFYLFGVFAGIMAATFFLLYRGGIGVLHEQFVSRMPSQFTAEQVSIVTLHPVEALIFMVKVSVVLGVAAVLPLLLYFAWPSLKTRGLARGDRRVLLVWGGTLVTALGIGSYLGFFHVAPAVISWLAADVLTAGREGMVIAYRINNYGWMVFFLTVGIGILAMIPATMLLFYRGGIVPYLTMRTRWREFVVLVFGLAAVFSPRGIFTMFLLGIPVVFAYGVGLGLLWMLTLDGRRERRQVEPAD
ncbi:Sec-independent protein translocase protein TatC [Natronomonas pharaonis DSM 2160]|uniref:Sec-independent protein translocase protein TatC n=1 Tax=Natronomonas pharaonis (strain ATCC 35678 / DSM 2160 / CIP 103997 / JCM 8858 / NBRC 14720 / NCIMB 2260 / Gabara) TaxID=348780 RepID=A0A1U7EUV0_NATPD|nr:twin-arginine translocase subunit TatC [Natronomonas pharaonis]CAI48766.1 Sec-independent protein translocase protein TatC [Natronomonas pharaonis DSM 2160]